MKSRMIEVAVLVGAVALVACGGSTSNDSGTGGGGSGNKSGSGGGGGSGGSGGSGGGVGGSGGGIGGSVGGAGSGGTGNVSGGGGSSGYAACSSPGTCMLVPNNCCGYCGSYEPITGYQGVNKAHYKDLLGELCADPQACPDCITFEDPNYLALCRSGTCTAIDLRMDPLSECQKDEDCRLRWGTGCCESCGGTPNELVTYNKNKSLEAEVCEPAGACPPCVPPEYPAGILALCSEGHCKTSPVGP